MDTGRAGARLRRPPRRRAATLRAAARRRRGAPARRHRRRAGAGGLRRRPVGGLLGRTGRSGRCRSAAAPSWISAPGVSTSVGPGLGRPRPPVLRPGRRPHLADPGRRGAQRRDDGGRRGSWRTSCPGRCPGGRALLYTVRKRSWSWGDEEIVAQTLATGARKVLLRTRPTRGICPPATSCSCAAACCSPCRSTRSGWRSGAAVAVLDTVAQALTAGNAVDVTGAGQFADRADRHAGLDRGPRRAVSRRRARHGGSTRAGLTAPGTVRSYGPRCASLPTADGWP